jgi:two-component system NarL family sensor kinase
MLTVIFFLSAAICYFYKTPELYINLFYFLYVPSIIALFVPGIFRIIKFTSKPKYYLIAGVFIFIFCGLAAFAGSYIPALNIESPISFFYIGSIIENVFFSLGLAFNIKGINAEKNKIKNSVAHFNYRQRISKIQGLIEGEEKEKNRIAEELHDGVTGDLSAIKINLSRLKQIDDNPKNLEIIEDISEIVEKSRLHIREISHNLSPHSIVNFGLIAAVKNYCESIESLYEITCSFMFTGDEVDINLSSQTHLYRIVQELINNIVKHSDAKSASVSISYSKMLLVLKISDDGKGFSFENRARGIGLTNIKSRIEILNGTFVKHDTETETGCDFTIEIAFIQIKSLSNKIERLKPKRF